MEKTVYTSRVRVNFDCSVRGIITPSITVEGIDTDAAEVLKLAAHVLDEALLEAKKRSTPQ